MFFATLSIGRLVIAAFITFLGVKTFDKRLFSLAGVVIAGFMVVNTFVPVPVPPVAIVIFSLELEPFKKGDLLL